MTLWCHFYDNKKILTHDAYVKQYLQTKIKVHLCCLYVLKYVDLFSNEQVYAAFDESKILCDFSENSHSIRAIDGGFWV